VSGLLLLLLGVAPAKTFQWTPDSARRHSVVVELDAYASSANVSRSLRDEPIPRLVSDGERATDWWLFFHLWRPRDVALELGGNPVPAGGWAMRKWAPDAYGDATWQGQNLVQAATEGIGEPWSVSLFLGNVVQLVPGTDSGIVNGMGYSGFQLTWGAWSLADNRMVRDDWIQAETKIEGEDIRPERTMGWSFRGGVREHFEPGIRDLLYGSIERSRTDFRYAGWNPLRNSSLELRMDLDRASLADFPSLDIVRWSAVVGKKFPFAGGRMAWALSAGVVQELLPAFTGSLRSQAPRGWGMVLQPNLEW